MPPHKLVFRRSAKSASWSTTRSSTARAASLLRGNNAWAWENDLDKSYKWTWTFWNGVLKHVLDEIGEKSVWHRALVAPDSPLPVTVTPGESDIEFVVRETPKSTFVIAARRQHAAGRATFCGVPTAGVAHGSSRSAGSAAARTAASRTTSRPYDVHVYSIFAIAPSSR